ncbi:MAG: glycosyltransferase family 4 protein [Promethearchaeota archaeon]
MKKIKNTSKKIKNSKPLLLKEKLFNFILFPINFYLLKNNKQALLNLKKLILSFKAKLIYVIEDHEWVINWVGKYITENLKKFGLIDAEIGIPKFSKKKIIHWGSINALIIENNKINFINNKNYNILTWYHIAPDDKKIKYIPLLNKKLDLIHTSCNKTKEKLITYGFDEKKVIVIPLGIDLKNFTNYNDKIKIKLKRKYGIPENKFIIGSFIKDGVGWGEGLKPKWVKGPDIFCETVKRLNRKYDIHVFLTGPARGYVKKKLTEYKIPFTHIFFNNHLKINECYNMLDLYLITSREEGGPLGIIESMACGVPLVSTKVGWAPELIKHGENGFLTEIDDIENLVKFCSKLIENEILRKKFIKNGLKIVKNFKWEIIAQKYYYKLYRKFLI